MEDDSVGLGNVLKGLLEDMLQRAEFIEAKEELASEDERVRRVEMLLRRHVNDCCCGGMDWKDVSI